MDITTKQEFLDYVDSQDVSQAIKDQFHAMSDNDLARILKKIHTSEQADSLLGAQF